MLGSQVIDIALGLVLVFLLMSLVLTAVQESLEAWLRYRAGDLNRAIFDLLQNDHALLRKFYDHPLVFALHRSGIGTQSSVIAVRRLLKERSPEIVRQNEQKDADARDGKPQGEAGVPLEAGGQKAEGVVAGEARVPSAREGQKARKELPSYIPRETFSTVLRDLFEQGEVKHERLVQAYEAVSRLSGGSADRIRLELESWYDGAMDRASGWFKRRTQFSLFVLGLASALLLNINAVVIAQHLATDQQARQYVTSFAERITSENDPVPDTKQIGRFQAELQDNVGLPIGWSDAGVAALQQNFPYRPALLDWSWNLSATVSALFALIVIALGYLIPAFAATLGPPFWFDVLNRIMVIRSTVKPKEKSPDEPSQDGGSGAAGGSTRSGALPLTGERASETEELDGCLSDHEIPEDSVRRDEDLPAAEGGVETGREGEEGDR